MISVVAMFVGLCFLVFVTVIRFLPDDDIVESHIKYDWLVICALWFLAAGVAHYLGW
jgi:hypothetical protein